MTSIAGIFQPSSGNPDCLRTAQHMAHRIAQARAERAQGLDFSAIGLSLGWTARTDSPPVWNESRTVALLFVGEHFPLESPHGAHAGPNGIIALYETHGVDFVSRLNGTFCGVLVDLPKKKALLFNDRFGLGRLYAHEAAAGLHFSTEAKALLAVLPSTRAIDQRGLAEFFSVGCVLQNRTLFRDIHLLPPSSLWILEAGARVEKRRYFDPAVWEQLPPLSAADYTDQLTSICRRIMPRYAGPPGTTAMSMTGGLDSRLILAWSQAAAGQLPCYTFGGPYRDCADVTIARKLAAIARQPHTTLRIEPDFFSEFSTLAERTVELSDGTMDVSGAVELYMNRRAKTLAPVRLTGNYGSEILRANIAFRPRPHNPALFTPEFNQLLGQAAETYRHEAKGHRLSFIAFKQMPWHHYARRSIECSELTPRSPYLDHDLVTLAYQCPAELRTSPAPVLQSVVAGNPAIDAVGTDRALRQHAAPLRDGLAHRWQEFTAKAEYAYDYGMPQWLTRADRILRPLQVERLFLGRHKFYHFRIWYRDQLATSLRDLVQTAQNLPSCYAKGVARAMVSEHTAGKTNHTLALHQLLTAQLTERTLTTAPCHN